MQDELIQTSTKFAMFGAAWAAFWAIMRKDPKPWYVRLAWWVFIVGMAFMSSEALHAMRPDLPAGVYGILGALFAIVVLPLLDWLSQAATDPIGTIKKAMDVWRGQS